MRYLTMGEVEAESGGDLQSELEDIFGGLSSAGSGAATIVAGFANNSAVVAAFMVGRGALAFADSVGLIGLDAYEIYAHG